MRGHAKSKALPVLYITVCFGGHAATNQACCKKIKVCLWLFEARIEVLRVNI